MSHDKNILRVICVKSSGAMEIKDVELDYRLPLGVNISANSIECDECNTKKIVFKTIREVYPKDYTELALSIVRFNNRHARLRKKYYSWQVYHCSMRHASRCTCKKNPILKRFDINLRDKRGDVFLIKYDSNLSAVDAIQSDIKFIKQISKHDTSYSRARSGVRSGAEDRHSRGDSHCDIL